MGMTNLLDTVLDRSVVLGYSKVGSALRQRWWPADPEPGALTGKRVLVTGATSGIGEAMARSFADLGAVVHVHGRNADKLAGVARQLRLDRPASRSRSAARWAASRRRRAARSTASRRCCARSRAPSRA